MQSSKTERAMPAAPMHPVRPEARVAAHAVGPQSFADTGSRLELATSERFIADFSHAPSQGTGAGPRIDAAMHTDIHHDWHGAAAGVDASVGMVELELGASQHAAARPVTTHRLTVAVVCAVALALGAIGLARIGRSGQNHDAPSQAALSRHTLDGPRIIANSLVAPKTGVAAADTSTTVLASKRGHSTQPTAIDSKLSAPRSATNHAAGSIGSTTSPAPVAKPAQAGPAAASNTGVAKAAPASSESTASKAKTAEDPKASAAKAAEDGTKFSALPPPPEDLPPKPAHDPEPSASTESQGGPQSPDADKDASS